MKKLGRPLIVKPSLRPIARPLGLAIGLTTGFTIWLAPAAMALPVRVERWLELREMTGRVQAIATSQTRPAPIGDRLQAIGDGLTTSKKRRRSC